jgi:hypothetical protein
MKIFLSSTLFAALIAGTAPPATAAPSFYAPTPFVETSNGPFTAPTFSYFFLVPLEDGLPTTSGLTSSAGGVTFTFDETTLGVSLATKVAHNIGDGNFSSGTAQVQTAPEPATLLLFGTGLALLANRSRRNARAHRRYGRSRSITLLERVIGRRS